MAFRRRSRGRRHGRKGYRGRRRTKKSKTYFVARGGTRL